MKYLIYGRHSKKSRHKFLATVADNKQEATEYMEEYPRYGVIPEMIPADKVLSDCKDTEQKISKILEEMNISDENLKMQNNNFSIKITGDWKHEHLHTDRVLEKLFDCIPIGEEVTDNDGSDFYTAIHTYLLP